MTGSRVLIVDDEPAVLSRALTEEGFETFEAGNRDEAMRCLAENSVDLITLDLQRDMAGREGSSAMVRRVASSVI